MSVLKHSITGLHLETKKCNPHIAKLIQKTFQHYPYIYGYVFHKASSLQIAIQISNVIRQPQYNRKQ